MGLLDTAKQDFAEFKSFLLSLLVISDSYSIFDLLPAGATKDYSTKLLQKGKITQIWIQFYTTQALLSYQFTLDGSQIIKNMPGGLNSVALSDIATSFPTNFAFDQGATLNVHVVNSDLADPHRVNTIIYLQYARGS